MDRIGDAVQVLVDTVAKKEDVQSMLDTMAKKEDVARIEGRLREIQEALLSTNADTDKIRKALRDLPGGL